MKINKTFLLAIFLLAGSSVFAQDTPAPAKEPTAAEPLVWYFGDGEGYLGVQAEDITRENMGEYKLSAARGVGIEKVIEDSPAAKAGLQNGDVVLSVNGEEVTSLRKFTRMIGEIAPDHQVKLRISRNGSERDITATLGKRSEMNMKGFEPFLGKMEGLTKLEGLGKLEGLKGTDKLFNTFSFGSYRRIGVSTMQLNKQLADYFGVSGDKGVLVTEVTENGPAAKAGIKAGDVIIAVDGETVDQIGDLSRAINKKKEGEITLTLIRKGSQQTIRVTPEEAKGGMMAPELFGNLSGQIRSAVIPQVRVTPPSVQVAPTRIVPRGRVFKRVI
jgi:serine protease Do